MKSVKLNKSHRYAIFRIMFKGVFEDEQAKVWKTEHELAEDIFKAYLEDKLTDSELRLLKKIPNNWLDHICSIKVQVRGGSYYNYHFGEGKRKYLPEYLYETACYAAVFNFDPKHELAVRVVAHQDAKRSLERRKTELEAEIWSIIDSCNTSKQLIEIWPEAQPTVEQVCAVTSTALMIAPSKVEAISHKLAEAKGEI